LNWIAITLADLKWLSSFAGAADGMALPALIIAIAFFISTLVRLYILLAAEKQARTAAAILYNPSATKAQRHGAELVLNYYSARTERMMGAKFGFNFGLPKASKNPAIDGPGSQKQS